MNENMARRLGKHDLGRYAFEKRMPENLVQLLSQEDARNRFYGIVDKLRQLLEPDAKVISAYLCRSSAVQVSKLKDEGNDFCGYRNMQMLLLSAGVFSSSEKLTIPYIQDMVENAWDSGINVHGRIQTGGIRNSRKHIGTSEAEAVLLSLGIACTANSFTGDHADTELLDFIEIYFAKSLHSKDYCPNDPQRVKTTTRPPIFLQRPSHSITVVGIEKLDNGTRRILTFDPAWQPPSHMRKADPIAESTLNSKLKRTLVLLRYRKPPAYLRRFKAFEVLAID